MGWVDMWYTYFGHIGLSVSPVWPKMCATQKVHLVKSVTVQCRMHWVHMVGVAGDPLCAVRAMLGWMSPCSDSRNLVAVRCDWSERSYRLGSAVVGESLTAAVELEIWTNGDLGGGGQALGWLDCCRFIVLDFCCHE